MTKKKKKSLWKRGGKKSAKDLIILPDHITLYNLFNLAKDGGKEIPPALMHLKPEYDFHIMHLKCTLLPKDGKDVEKFELHARVTGGGKGRGRIHVHDVAPKTEWVDKPYGGTVKIAIDPVKTAMHFVIPAVPSLVPVDTVIGFHLKWQPKEAAVDSGGNRRIMYLILKKSSKKYRLNGDNELLAVLQRRRRKFLDNLRLRIDEATTKYGSRDKETLPKHYIPLAVMKSKPH